MQYAIGIKGRRTPDGTARTLLCVLQDNPRAVLDALGQTHAQP